MKNFISIIIFLSLGQSVSGQPLSGECYFSTKVGLVRSRLIILPLSDNKYVFEFYQYGMGIFWGLPYKDTLAYANNVFKSDKNAIAIKRNKLRITTRESTRKFKFSTTQSCDENINWTRNWSYREAERYKIKDEEKATEFLASTDPLLRTHCHEDFLLQVNKIEKDLGLRE